MIEDLYNVDFITYRNTEVSDGSGGTIRTGVAKINARGRFEPISGDEYIYNEKKELVADFRVYVKLADIVEKDYMIISGVTYDITLVQSYGFGFNPHLEVYLRQRR
jgi:SPP1 family predicted phage head-tail adaptor